MIHLMNVADIQIYLVLSKNGTVSDDQVIAGPAILAST